MVAATLAAASPASAQAFICDGLPATIVGTPGNDVLPGTPGDDVIVALGGNDRILAGDGNDTVCGGPGNDFVRGQRGNDTLLGGAGRDLMFGNAGPDTLVGGDGNDVLWGGVGPDEIYAGPGNDTIHAGHGNDFAIGGTGKDTLNGSTGADELWGGQGVDSMRGGIGFDDLFGEGANDLLIGGPGEDFLAGGPGSDRCRVDITDVFVDCQRGNVRGDAGFGNGEFVPALAADYALQPPGGPAYILHVDASPLPGQILEVTVYDADNGVLFEGAGFDPVFSNVLIAGGVPARVQVSGADFWSAAFIKPAILFDDLVFNPDQGSQVFGVAPSLDGFDQEIAIFAENTGFTNSIFQLISIGSEGIILELDDTLGPGETVAFEGLLRASAQYVAILSGAVDWDFELVNG